MAKRRSVVAGWDPTYVNPDTSTGRPKGVQTVSDMRASLTYDILGEGIFATKGIPEITGSPTNIITISPFMAAISSSVGGYYTPSITADENVTINLLNTGAVKIYVQQKDYETDNTAVDSEVVFGVVYGATAIPAGALLLFTSTLSGQTSTSLMTFTPVFKYTGQESGAIRVPTFEDLDKITLIQQGTRGLVITGDDRNEYVYNSRTDSWAISIDGDDVASATAEIARPTVATHLLDLPTPDNNPAVTHPSVIEAPNGSWKGYRYWMAMTPYPTEPRENPCVLVSNDKRNWEIPTGGTNPVVPLAEAIAAGYEYGSDTELIFVDDNTLMMFYRFAISTTPPLKEIILYKTSTDGINWSAPVTVGLSNSIRNDTLLSPAVIRLANGDMAMYTVNASGSYGVVERRLSTDNGLTWGSPTTCATPNDHSPWHIAIRLVDGVYYLLSCDRNPGAPTVLVFMTSTDGINFTGDTGWSVPLIGATYDAGGYYRSTFLPAATKFGGPISFDVFATVMNAGKTSHRVALFENLTPNREAKLQRADNATSVITDKYRVLLADSFTRKAASGIGSPDIGSAWERYQDSGTNPPIILNNRVRFGGTILQGIMVSNTGLYYGTLSALITMPASGGTDGGLVMCAGASNADFIQIAVARDAATYNRITINTHIAGAIVTVATNNNVNLQYGTTYKVEASLSKTGLLNVFLDGQLVLTYALTSPELAVFTALTRHGIYSHYDNVTYYRKIRFSSAFKAGSYINLSYGSLHGVRFVGGEGFAVLEGTAGFRIKNSATAEFRLVPAGNNVYLQNSVSGGDIFFTGANGADLSGNVIFKTSSSVRPDATLVASLGTSLVYWTGVYTRNVYLNSTAYLNGLTAGIIAVTGAMTITGTLTASNISGTNTGDQTATTVQNTPAGGIAATTVQAAINELDTEKLSKDGSTIVVDATNHRIGMGVASPTAVLDVNASTTANAQLRLRSGVAPTTPNDGDIWFDGTDIKLRVAGVTKTFTLV